MSDELLIKLLAGAVGFIGAGLLSSKTGHSRLFAPEVWLLSPDLTNHCDHICNLLIIQTSHIHCGGDSSSLTKV